MAKPVHAPTVREIVQDRLTQLSLEYWAPGSTGAKKPYDPKVRFLQARCCCCNCCSDTFTFNEPSTERQVVEQIYAEELQTINLNRLMLLELSQYLEEYDLPPFCSLHMT